jgi:hypothetical protein
MTYGKAKGASHQRASYSKGSGTIPELGSLDVGRRFQAHSGGIQDGQRAAVEAAGRLVGPDFLRDEAE